MIVNAQGGEEKAKYGNGLIKKYSARLTSELGKGYFTITLKYMRQFYLFLKCQPVADQIMLCLMWSHLQELLPLKNIDEINYYINQISIYHWSKRILREKVKNREYQRLSDEAKNKLINKFPLNIYSLIINKILKNLFVKLIDF